MDATVEGKVSSPCRESNPGLPVLMIENTNLGLVIEENCRALF
jgi:hypothetical protein